MVRPIPKTMPEYWIVDGDRRAIRVVRQGRDDVIAEEMLRWHPAGAE